MEPVQNGAVLLLDEQGKTLLAHRAETALVPASSIKILTSLITAEQLGLDFRCRTEFFKDAQGRLGIKGFGDPYLISEEIALIAAELIKRGETSFSGLQLDSSAFEVPAKAPGTTATLNPYDALNGALAVNFNSLMIRRDAAGKVHSAEEVTPLTPMAQQKGLALKPGFADRINLTDRPEEAQQYVGELFRAIFLREGIEINGETQIEPLGASFKPLMRHYNSRKLPVMLEGMLRYSNNYIANQLFLITGAEASGWPAERSKALAAFRQAVQKRFSPTAEEFRLVEASGISRENHVTGQFLVQVLEAFKPHYLLLHPHKRLEGVYLKSGTLTGVYNFAGYFKTAKGLRPFVLFLNQPQNRRELVLERLKAFSDNRP
ncbi:MAG: D-alanyl-D-alanine carboxypeptidase [bacterium]|nr:D-alanyl-D-alanine carboxypeptidase [bacterium]